MSETYILDACALIALLKDENDAKLLTADHHEFDAVERAESIAFQWIR